MRIEKDSLGERSIPADAYYGVQTHRAIENFPISGLLPKPSYVDATVQIKKAAAKVNKELGLLDAKKADAIVQAADEILSGKLREWFVVDVYQAGAGTSHNMNANEVIANRAIEILGGKKGDYSRVHPNDHVNMAQSTNDVCPTAIRIGALLELRKLFPSLSALEKALAEKAKAFDHIVKSGRTHLQDAVPLRLGQEFGGYAVNVRKHLGALELASNSCKELGIGGTAAGTGLNAHPKYRELMVKELSSQLGFKFRMADDYFEAMQSLRPMVEVSGALRNLAQDLIRIANDLRLLSSGPKTGLAEINLPARSARLFDHARKGESGDGRNARHGLLPGHRLRHDDYAGGTGGSVGAQCDDARRCMESASRDRDIDDVDQRICEALCRGDYSERSTMQRVRRGQHEHCHCSQSSHRIRQSSGDCERVSQVRQIDSPACS